MTTELEVTTAPAAVEDVGAVACTGYSISEDGATALLRFTRDNGATMLLTFPVGMLGGMQGIIREMRSIAEERELPAGSMQAKRPQTFMVGHTQDARGHVAISFNHKLADEDTFLLRDDLALKLVEALRVDIFGRMTPRDRLARDGQRDPLGTKRKLILPN